MERTISRRSMMMAAGSAGVAAAGLGLPGRASAGILGEHADAARVAGAGKQGAGYYRFNVGSVEGTVVSDGWFGFTNLHPMFAPEATKAELEKALSDALMPTDKAVGELNTVVLKIGKELVLIDAGMGSAGKGGSSGRMMENLASAGYAPEQITGVVLTHAHGDHINGLVTDDGKPAFPNARVFINKAEFEFFTGPGAMPNSRLPEADAKGMAANAAAKLAILKGKLDLVKPGDKVMGGLEFVDAAGHTPGHMCVSVDGGSEKLFVTGDLAHNHVVMFHNPDWTIVFDADPKMAAAARKRIFPMLAADRARVLAYHLPWPGFGRVGKHGDGYWWSIEPWAWGG